MKQAQLEKIPAELIDAGDNDRSDFDAGELAHLAASIASVGLAQPPTVRKVKGRYRIVAGERRVRACKQLGWDTIPALVRGMSDADEAEVMLVENLVRVDLDPVAEGYAYCKRVETGATVDDIVAQTGRTRLIVETRMRLTTLVPEVQRLVACGQLSADAARYLFGLDANRQILAMRAYTEGSLTTGQFRAVTDRIRREQEAQPLFDLDTFMQVEEYVVSAVTATAETKLGKISRLAAALADQAEQAGLAADLVAEIRATVATTSAAAWTVRLVIDPADGFSGNTNVPYKNRKGAERRGDQLVTAGLARSYRIEEVA